MKTDHWFYGLFQSAPDLIALLLPAAGAAGASAVPSLGPDSPGDALYRFEAPELKAASHRLDGAFWPRSADTGTPEQPVVLLEVQMQGKAGFKHRLWAQTARFAQLHPQVQYLEVVVVVPHRRLRLGPDRLPRQLEALAVGEAFSAGVALLDFTGPADLAVWLEKHKGSKPLGRRQPPAGGERNPTQCPGRQHLKAKDSEGAKRVDEPGLRLLQYCFGY